MNQVDPSGEQPPTVLYPGLNGNSTLRCHQQSGNVCKTDDLRLDFNLLDHSSNLLKDYFKSTPQSARIDPRHPYPANILLSYVSSGHAKRLIVGGEDVILFPRPDQNGQLRQEVFQRATELRGYSAGSAGVTAKFFENYYLHVNSLASSISDEIGVDSLVIDPLQNSKTQEDLAITLLWVHAIPGGGTADALGQGKTGEAILSLGGDLCVGAGWLARAGKTVLEVKMLKAVATIETGMAVVHSGRATYSAYNAESGSEAAAYAGEAFLSMLVAAGAIRQLRELRDFDRLAPNRPLGGRGPNSGREFDPSKAGGPIRQLSTDKIKITDRGIDFVERHLERFGPDPANQAMVQRLRDIASGKIKPTQTDLNFYSHELRESIRYKKLGFPSGQPESVDEAYDLWNNAHTGTLEDYRLREGPGVLYHPSANP